VYLIEINLSHAIIAPDPFAATQSIGGGATVISASRVKI